MTLRFIISASVALVVANAARAEDAVNISAGEHGRYSRLVVAGAVGDLSVSQSGREVDIRFSNHIDTFNFSDVNERRKAHRVLGARAVSAKAGSRVRLQLNCDCVLKSAQLTDAKWILDIYDADDAARSNEAKSNKIAAANRQSVQTASTQSAKNKNHAARTSNDIPSADAAGGDDDLSVEQAHKRMMDLLQQAAEEGLVTIKSEDIKKTAPNGAASDAAQDVAALDPGRKGENKDGGGAENTAPAPGPCLADEDFFIDGARFEKDPLIEISALQSQLARASLEEQKAIVEELAGGYLAIGFGEEALALLADYDKMEELIADIARVVAEKPAPASGVLMNAVNCRGAHALWQAAASKPVAAVGTLKRSENAVATLPTRLRALMATRIARKMIDANDWTDATRFYEIAAAASEIPSPSLQYVEARLREHEGALDESQQMLLDLAAGESEASKDALLTLAEQYADGEGRPHEGFVEDIGAVAKVERGSKTGVEAAFVEADIWADAGDVDASLLLLNDAAEADPEIAGAARARARKILSKPLASNVEEDRIDALGAYLEYRKFLAEPGDDSDFHRQVAGAALDLGLPNVAYQALNARAHSGDRASAKLKTRAALQSYNTEAALAAAAPYTDDQEFAVMVVRANMQEQKFYAALAAASALPETDGKSVLMALSAWRAGDWESAARAFAAVNPRIMGEKMALQYAMSAYMAGATSMPSSAEAVLRKEKSAALDGAKSLFDGAPNGPVMNRAETLAAGADAEIKLIEKALGRG
ncbi:MAG: hypothetical protein ACE5FO_04065 [Parvularculaceae bacterium]